MAKGKTLGEYIEKWHVKKADWKGEHELEVLGVSNVEGITTTSHVKSQDLSGYLVIQPNTFAYNPYRINVGSVGLTPNNVFGVVSPAYIVFKVREGKLIPELLLEFLKSFDGLQQINKYARGTVRKALRFDDLCKIEVNFPDYNEQKNIFEKKLIVGKKSDELETEIQTQKQLLTKLKQSILQEAIQGKLTADWREQNPNTEPASELLKRIKAEKAQLIKNKKIKKEKPLPPITKEEIPFELPEGWVWCRLGEITTYGSSEKIDSQEIKPDTWVLDLEDIEKESSKILQFKTFSERPSLSTKSVFKKGWVLYSKLRPYLDKVVVVPKDGVCTTEILPLPIYSNLTAGYFLYTLKGKHFLSYVNSKVGGMKMPRLGTDDGKMALIPIAPVEEQKAIVEKVESLMQKCQGLEQEIKSSEANAQMLMQAVLKEAFEGKEEVVEV